ncbi:MAG: leucine-rich repeat domain-containing protein [Verrucomicrobia bacterium]|nr:leucine-rich repeat domain-containing protein [Verrucomicrobiota bacterium]
MFVYIVIGFIAIAMLIAVALVSRRGFLTTISVPVGASRIGKEIFYECKGVTRIEIPATVKEIRGDSLAGCSRLLEFVVSPDNPSYCSVNGVLFNKDQTVLIKYPAGRQGPYVIPNGVETISDRAFSWSTGLTAVSIPSSVKKIEDRAFYSCKKLTSLNSAAFHIQLGSDVFKDTPLSEDQIAPLR